MAFPVVSDAEVPLVVGSSEEVVPAVRPEASVPDSPNVMVKETTPVVEIAAPVVRLATRSLSEGPLTEGKLCVFQVVMPVTMNGRSFFVGDMIQAHIDIIDAGSGRVYLRTDRLTSAQTQETSVLKMVATEQPKQPGVALPTRLENWQLSWEAL